MRQCTQCGKKVPNGHSHWCKAAGGTVSAGSDFMVSVAVGYATGDAIIGGLAGGSFAGGMVGEALSDDDGGGNSFDD